MGCLILSLTGGFRGTDLGVSTDFCGINRVGKLPNFKFLRPLCSSIYVEKMCISCFQLNVHHQKSISDITKVN